MIDRSKYNTYKLEQTRITGNIDSEFDSFTDDVIEQEEIVDNLQSVIVENPSFDNDDLLEIVQEVYGDVKKEVSQKVSRKAEAPKKPIEKKSTKQNYVDFEDL